MKQSYSGNEGRRYDKLRGKIGKWPEVRMGPRGVASPSFDCNVCCDLQSASSLCRNILQAPAKHAVTLLLIEPIPSPRWSLVLDVL